MCKLYTKSDKMFYLAIFILTAAFVFSTTFIPKKSISTCKGGVRYNSTQLLQKLQHKNFNPNSTFCAEVKK